jgi:hypothetical protein
MDDEGQDMGIIRQKFNIREGGRGANTVLLSIVVSYPMLLQILNTEKLRLCLTFAVSCVMVVPDN